MCIKKKSDTTMCCLASPAMIRKSYGLSKLYKKSRSGFTLIEVIIAMVLLAVIFGTFLLAVVSVQSVNKRSATITDFMFETSQKNVDSKIDKIGTYLEVESELVALRKKKDKIATSSGLYTPTEYTTLVSTLESKIHLKESELSQLSSMGITDHTRKRIIRMKSGNSVKVNRMVEVYEFTTDLIDYKKANVVLRDSKGNKISNETPNTNNEFYSFGKVGGNTSLYYLFAGVVPSMSLPDPVIYSKNEPDYCYLGETVKSEYALPHTSPEYNFFNYWHLSDSRISSDSADTNLEVDKLSRPLFSERRHYKDSEVKYSYKDPETLQNLINAYCPSHKYEKLVGQKDPTMVAGDFKKYAGKFLTMGVQPAKGNVGAAFPLDLSPYETYVMPIARIRGLHKHVNPSMMSLTSIGTPFPNGDDTMNIMSLDINTKSDQKVADGATAKPGVTHMGSINTIMSEGKIMDAMVDPSSAFAGKYEAQFIPVWAKGDSQPNVEMMSLYPRQARNNYEELSIWGRTSPHNANRLPLFKVDTDFKGNNSNYSAANVFKVKLDLNEISKRNLTAELRDATSDSTLTVPDSGDVKMLTLNNMGMNLVEMDSEVTGQGVVFLKFYAGDLCDKPYEDSSSLAFMQSLGSPNLTERVMKEIKKEIKLDTNEFEKMDDKHYICDLIRFGLEDKKRINESSMVPMLSLSYTLEAVKNNDGIQSLTAPLLMSYPSKHEAKNGTKARFLRANAGNNGDWHEYGDDFHYARLDSNFSKQDNHNILASLIEPDKLNTITMFYQLYPNYVGNRNSQWKRMIFAVYVNGFDAGMGEIDLKHNNYGNTVNMPVISLGGRGNLNLVEAIQYTIPTGGIFSGVDMSQGHTALNKVRYKINNTSDWSDLKQVHAYAELPDADGLLLDNMKKYEFKKYEEVVNLFKPMSP